MSQSGRKTMSKTEFREIRKRLGLSSDEFAIELGYEGTRNGNRKTIERFERGMRAIPLPVAKLAFMLDTRGIPEWPEYLEASPAQSEDVP